LPVDLIDDESTANEFAGPVDAVIGGLVGPDALATTPADAGGDAAGGALIVFALTVQPR
jgi:hypothetical protein